MDDPAQARERLETAYRRLREARAAVEDIGETRLEALDAAVYEADSLLTQYEESATGTGDFGAYLRFRGDISALVEDLPDDLPERDAFERVDDIVDKRRLSVDDFSAARSALKEARRLRERLNEREAAEDAYRDARRAADRQISELESQIEDLDRTIALGEADFDAPIEILQTPITSYNHAVRDAVRELLATAPAPVVLDLFAMSDRYPLVDMPSPPEALQQYVEQETPSLTVHELIEFAGYSRSKLAHYVDDPAAFAAAVATERSYLESIDEEPFTIAWPPPPATHLRWYVRELISVVGRFADDEVIALLRDIRSVTLDEARYTRLRTSAIAQSELTDNEHDQLRRGEIQANRDALTAAKERLEAALDATARP